MRSVRRWLAVAAVALAPVLLAACSSTPSSSPSSGAPAGDPLDSPATARTLTQVQNGLNAVDNGLTQVKSDNANAQGDS